VHLWSVLVLPAQPGHGTATPTSLVGQIKAVRLFGPLLDDIGRFNFSIHKVNSNLRVCAIFARFFFYFTVPNGRGTFSLALAFNFESRKCQLYSFLCVFFVCFMFPIFLMRT
jgi:hypothetical protein